MIDLNLYLTDYKIFTLKAWAKILLPDTYKRANI